MPGPTEATGRLTLGTSVEPHPATRTVAPRAIATAHRQPPPAHGHPGGQSKARPPIRWTCRWSTVWPPQRPTFETSRYPPSAIPSVRARSAATPNRRPRSGPSASVNSAADAMWRRGISRMWVGARGAMSRKATTRSSSWRRSDGIDPAAIRQKRQSVGRRLGLVGSAASPQHRLRAHQEPDRADQSGHQVRHVALALGPFQPRLVVGGGPDADEAAQVRALDEERDAEVDEVDRERDQQPRLLEAAPTRASATRPIPVSASPIPMAIVPCVWAHSSDRTTPFPDSTVARRVRSANGSRIEGRTRLTARMMCAPSRTGKYVGINAIVGPDPVRPGGRPPAPPSRPRRSGR